MKSVILVALALVAVAAAIPVPEEPEAIVRSDYNQQPEGGYDFAFETAKGITRVETGELKEVLDEENKPKSVVVVRGSYGYNDVEGKPVSVNYFADETGFHAEGEIIPKPAQS